MLVFDHLLSVKNPLETSLNWFWNLNLRMIAIELQLSQIWFPWLIWKVLEQACSILTFKLKINESLLRTPCWFLSKAFCSNWPQFSNPYKPVCKSEPTPNLCHPEWSPELQGTSWRDSSSPLGLNPLQESRPPFLKAGQEVLLQRWKEFWVQPDYGI